MTFDLRMSTNSGSINAYLSGMSRHTTRLFLSDERNCADSFWRCVFSMTKMMSAHSTSSTDNGVSASGLVPAYAVSISG